MKTACKHFRNSLTQQLEEHLPIERILEQGSHHISCPECEQFVREYLVLEDKLQVTGSEAVDSIGSSQFRQKVWQEIDRREECHRYGFRNALKPLAVAAVLILMVSVGIYWYSANHPDAMVEETVSIDEMIAEELSLTALSEEELTLIIEEELSDEIIDYFIQHANYEMLEDVYTSRDQWDAIITDLAQAEL